MTPHISKRSCVLSIIVCVMVVIFVGMLVIILTGERNEDLLREEDENSEQGGLDHGGAYPRPSDDQGYTETNSDAPWQDFRLPKYTLPVHYDLLLQPDLKTDIFGGTVNITVNVTRETKHFIVHSHMLTIEDSKLYDVQQDIEISIERQFHFEPNEYYVLSSDSDVNPGSYKLYFSFRGMLNGSIVGFYKSRYTNSKNETRYLATSKFQPTDARRAFPCFDEPSFKSTFSVALVHPKDYIALSNMPAQVTGKLPLSDLYLTKFQKSVPMVTYLACFIVCDFEFQETVTASGKPFRVYSAPHLVNSTTYAVEVGSKVLNYYEDYFGIEYPLPKQDMIAIPDFPSGAMEHWGLITFRETNLLYNPQHSSPQERVRVAEVIAHEMVHMWFGNLVTMEWWDDLWLNEGFASYMEYKGVDEQHPEWDEISQFVTDDLHPVMDLDSAKNSHPIVQRVHHPDEITEIFDSISYSKGASVLRMLEFFVGKENFRKGISNFLKKHMYGNAKTSDLWEELSQACGYQGNRSISDIMKTWTEQMGLPYITVKRNFSTNSFVAQQKRFLMNEVQHRQERDTSAKYTWSVPLSYVTSNGSNGIIWIHDNDEKKFSLPVQNSDWVKFNLNQTGYYLVDYDDNEWIKLIDLLKTNHEVLTPTDRANLLFDAYMLAQGGLMEFDVFLSMSTYLKNEKHLTPWETAFDSFEDLLDLLETSEVNLLLKSHVRDLTDDLYKKLSWNTSDNHLENLLRTTIISLSCRAGNPDCLSEASELFENWIQGNDIPLTFRTLVLRYGMSEVGSEEHWTFMWNKLSVEGSPARKRAYLRGLASIRQPSLISRYLEYAMDETKVRSQDFFYVLSALTENPKGRPLVWKFIREKWPAIVERFTLNSRYLGKIVKTTCTYFTSDRELEEMKAFFSKYPDAGAGKRARQQALEEVQTNINWMKSHIQDVKEWLELESTAPWHYHRLPSHIVPEHYDLMLYPMFDQDIFKGTVDIYVDLRKPSHCFLVHAVGINVTSHNVTTHDESETVTLERMFMHKENDFLVLKPSEKLPVGKYKLHFEFEGPFNLSLVGLYKSSYLDPVSKEKRYLAATQFEAIEARKAFPCFDEPAFKSTFNVSIVHNATQIALSNTMEESVTEIEDDLRLTRFEKSLPMVTYLLAVAVCDFDFKETITENGVRLRVYAPPHQVEMTNYSLNAGNKILTWFENYFGVVFPLKKLDMIVIPDFSSGGMENWGLITYADFILISENVSSSSTKYGIATLIAHELAHMWFGDLVTMRWWDDLWLNEGFATYMATKAVNYYEPEYEKNDHGGWSRLVRAMKSDQTVNSHSIVQPVVRVNQEIFDGVTYSKGATVLRMLENYMGEDFKEGISAHLKKYSYGNAVTQDLWDSLAAASKQDLNVASIMDTWTKQMNFPFLKIERVENSSNSYLIQQHRFLENSENNSDSNMDSPYNYVWQIPLTYTTSESNVSYMLLNTSEKVPLNLPNAQWIKLNVNFSGYYMVNYDRSNWNMFIKIFQSNHSIFNEADRVNLLYDALSLASAGELDYAVALNLTKYLKNEDFYGSWLITLEELVRIKRFFDFEPETKDIIEEYIRSLSKDLLKKTTWNDSNDFAEKKLRRLLILGACGNGDQECLTTASHLLKQWMNGSELSTETKDLVYRFGLKVQNDEETWNYIWHRYLEEEDTNEKHKLMQTLTSIRNMTLLERLMQYSKNESWVRKHDYFWVLGSMGWNPDGFPLMTDLIFNNYTDLVEAQGVSETAEFARYVLRRYNTPKNLEKVKHFYSKNAKHPDASRSSILAIEEIRKNIDWLQKHQTYVRSWFWQNVYMPWKESRLPRHITPLKYSITLHPNISRSTLEGEEDIELDITKETDCIVLHVSGLKIAETQLVRLSGETVVLDETFFYKRNEFYVIRMKRPVPIGTYVLRMKFSGVFSVNGYGPGLYQYTHRETNEVRYLFATFLQATHARKVFPCFDEPEMKAKFQISLVHDAALTAVSNMPEDANEIVQNGLVKSVFMESPKMSTYLIFCMVSDFDYLQMDFNGKPIRAFSPPDRIQEAEHGLNLTVKLLGRMEEYFDVPFALPKLDSIAIPNYTIPGMEHWGAIVYRSNRFLTDGSVPEFTKLLGVDRIISHELVHQWFGDLVTVKWWSDVWLSEGMASMMMYQFLKQDYPVIEEVQVREMSKMMCDDSRIRSHPIVHSVSTLDEISGAFDTTSYQKGAAVMRMFLHLLKDDFHQGLSSYLKKYAFRNADTEDFSMELSNASTIDINIPEMVKVWSFQKGYPYIELHRNGDRMQATQHWFNTDNNDTQTDEMDERPAWIIPLMYKNMTDGKENILWLKDYNASFEVGEKDLLKFNPGFGGYYIVKYNSRDWARFSHLLQQNHMQLDAIDRYNLLYDAFRLADTDRLSYNVPLELTQYLKKETNFLSWNLFRDQYLQLLSKLDSRSETYNLLQEYVRELTSELYDDYVFGDQASGSHFQRWDRSLRGCSLPPVEYPELNFLSILIDLACQSSNRKCLDFMYEEFQLWISGKNITADLRLVFELAIPHLGNDTVWEILYAKLNSSYIDLDPDFMLLESLTYFSNPSEIMRTIDVMMNDPKIDLELADFMFLRLLKNPAAVSLLWNYTRQNWELDLNRSDGKHVLSAVLYLFCQEVSRTTEQMTEFSNFLEAVPAAREAIVVDDQCIRNMKASVEWLNKHEETIVTWLDWNVNQS